MLHDACAHLGLEHEFEKIGQNLRKFGSSKKEFQFQAVAVDERTWNWIGSIGCIADWDRQNWHESPTVSHCFIEGEKVDTSSQFDILQGLLIEVFFFSMLHHRNDYSSMVC